MRYIVVENTKPGSYFVYDTEKQSLVWLHTDHNDAIDMRDALNDIENKPSQLPKKPAVPVQLVQRVRNFAAVCDIRGVEFINKADAAENRCEFELAKEHGVKAVELRQRSRDLYTLLEAAGVSLED